MNDRKSKQVIVMRKSFIIEGKKITPRKGKYIAQGAHASMKAILDFMSREGYGGGVMILPLGTSYPINHWLNNGFTKVVCCVETEEEIISIYNKAKEKGLLCSLIKDSGHTEFNGIPTITCCAVGPAWSDQVDEITGNLELF
jgi:PTH2 family peptidyl-tRNA hydrolase